MPLPYLEAVEGLRSRSEPRSAFLPLPAHTLLGHHCLASSSGNPLHRVTPVVWNYHPAWWGAALQLPGDKTRSALMTMSGSLGAPRPSTCWVQNRAQHGEGQRTEPAFHSGHPGHLEFALGPGRTQKGRRQAMLGCGELEVFLGLSLCYRG